MYRSATHKQNDVAKQHRRNLLMMWLDYKKPFDSVPQDWILKH